MTHKISPNREGMLVRPVAFRQFVFLMVAVSCLCSVAMAQTTTTLVESSYVTTAGNASSQPVATSINLLDESGTASTWSKYVEFNTNLNAVYAGYQLFTLPTSIAPGSVTAIQVKVNYRGPSTATQTWTWQLFNWATNSYVTVGTNAGAPDWGAWTILTFNAGGTLANYIRSSDGQIKVQLLSNNPSDAADIDYEAVLVTYSSGPPPVSVSISPTSATLNGGGTQQFTATVSGTTNTAVTWSLAGTGTLSASGFYTAPASVASQTTATVTATSQADTTKSASATVTINPVAVSISPTSASVPTNATQQFTATVSGTSNTAVNWQVNGVAGGNSTVGTISTSGLYTAPSTVPSPATVTVAAVSQADSTKSAPATVTVTAQAQVSVSVAPASASVQVANTQQFTATVTGTSNTAVTWQVNGVTGGNSTVGTITSSGLYTAPSAVPSPATVTVTAISQADTTKSGSASVTVTASSNLAFYVSTIGNDANPGTLSAPWRTIQHAVNTATLPGDTINVRGGTYNERVSMGYSGSASGGQITLQSYPGELAIVDGTGIAVGTGGYAYGLVDITGQSYVTVSGLEIRNFTASGKSVVPAGIHVEGSGSNIQILNNHIHDIVIQGNSCNTTNGFGLIAVGTNGTAPMTNLTISGNELDHMVTGCSETMTVNGNVQYFTVSNNKVHDNNNIGIAALGGEGVASGYSRYNGSPNDQARNGTISGNTVYNITSNNNPVYKGSCNCADGIYLDGSAYVIVERNVVHNVDINEVAGEGSGQNTDHNTVRNNLFYSNGVTGLSIGGQTNVGSASNVTVVNNTFFNNGTYGGSVSLGEFTTGINLTGANIFENNIAYAGFTGVLIKAVTTNSITLDRNIYYSTASPSWIWGSSTYSNFASYQTATGQDAHSLYANPQFLSTTTTPPNLDISSTSPANDAGVNLGSNVVGTLDFAGNPRVQGAGIEIGAYEH
jgi:hypothetical protein